MHRAAAYWSSDVCEVAEVHTTVHPLSQGFYPYVTVPVGSFILGIACSSGPAARSGDWVFSNSAEKGSKSTSPECTPVVWERGRSLRGGVQMASFMGCMRESMIW